MSGASGHSTGWLLSTGVIVRVGADVGLVVGVKVEARVGVLVGVERTVGIGV